MKNFILALTLTSSAVFAQEVPRSIYFGGNIGYAALSDQTASINTELVQAFGGSASSTQSTGIEEYRFFGGYILNENISIELGYMATSKISLSFNGVSSGQVAYTGSISDSYSGGDLSLVLHPNRSTGLENMFVNFGVTSYTDKSTLTATATRTGTWTDNQSGTGTLYGVGYDKDIPGDLTVRGMYTRLDKVAGQSGSSANILSIGLLKKF